LRRRLWWLPRLRRLRVRRRRVWRLRVRRLRVWRLRLRRLGLGLGVREWRGLLRVLGSVPHVLSRAKGAVATVGGSFPVYPNCQTNRVSTATLRTRTKRASDGRCLSLPPDNALKRMRDVCGQRRPSASPPLPWLFCTKSRRAKPRHNWDMASARARRTVAGYESAPGLSRATFGAKPSR